VPTNTRRNQLVDGRVYSDSASWELMYLGKTRG
jgi:hypothetical protein